MSKVIGIDLGTTNSCVAVVEGGQSRVIPNKGGYRTTPSIVAIGEDGRRLIGHLAKRQLVTNPKNTIYASKRLIGRRWDSQEVKRAQAAYPFELVKGQNEDVRIKIQNKELSLPEAGAMIIQEMRQVAEDYLGEEVGQAVITVPAYFNDSQRQATKDAGTIAGLDVLRIINEPTSAALAYGYGKGITQTVAIYDLGGGTFDISIMDITEGVFEVKATSGDTYLGGDDFDDRLIDHMAEEFLKKENLDLRKDKMALQRLKDAAEKAKTELSSAPKANVNLPFIASTADGPKHLELSITREELEGMTSDLVDRTFEICEAAKEDSGLKPDDIEQVILVGGQTRMPLVQKRVQEFFGKPPRKGVHPDEVVAIGAAIQGEILLHKDTDMVLLDVTPLSLGIATFGGFFTKLIERNTTIPVRRGHVFTTAADNQGAVKIHVLQGESDRATENELLGEFILSGIPKAKRGEPEIEVSFDIDSDGIVSVSARDKATGTEQSITVTASSGLSDEEIQSMVDSSKDYEVELKSEAEYKKLRHNFESLARRVNKALEAGGVEQEISDEAQSLTQKGKMAVEYADVETLKQIIPQIQEIVNKLK